MARALQVILVELRTASKKPKLCGALHRGTSATPGGHVRVSMPARSVLELSVTGRVGKTLSYRLPTAMRPTLAVAFLAVLLTSCTPSLSPLYRDYEVRSGVTAGERLGDIGSAMTAAGWMLTEPAVAGTVATDFRTIGSFGFYKVVVSIEAIPVGGRYVRLLIHPYRDYIVGGRSKIPYMNRSIRRAVVPRLTKALDERGIVVIGTPIDRDKKELKEAIQ